MKIYKQAQTLLLLARKDLASAMILARSEEMNIEAVGFHIQQAAEKSLKAWLEILGVIYPKTHDLSLLLGELEDHGEKVDSFWPIIELNPFAVEFRYSLYEDEFVVWEDLYQSVNDLVTYIEKLLQATEKKDLSQSIE